MSEVTDRPMFPRDDTHERQRFYHHLEWPTNGWQYTTTRVKEADHPGGWVPVEPDGWSVNTDRWPTVDEEAAGWTRVGPGVLRNPYAPGGVVLVAFWRRQS